MTHNIFLPILRIVAMPLSVLLIAAWVVAEGVLSTREAILGTNR